MINVIANIVGAGRAAGYDPDAQAFFSAVEGGGDTLTATQKSAINQLVTDMKAAGVWTKCRALYPFIGGTASAHKWNLKDPRDLDAAYRMTFAGSPTHNANGVATKGTTQYGDTYMNNAAFGGSEGVSLYGSLGANAYAGGINGGTQTNYVYFPATLKITYNHFDASGNESAAADNLATGFKGCSKVGTDTHFRGNTLSETKATGAGALTSSAYTFVMSGLRNATTGAVADLSANTFKTFILTSGMTLADLGNLGSAVTTYNTTLGRNV